MERQLDYDLLNRHAKSERTEFYKNTYKHVAIAVLCFVLLELIMFQTGIAKSIAKVLLGGRWTWMIVLGAFMFVSNIANNWAQNSTSRKKQYYGLALYTFGEAIIFVPLLYMASIYAPKAIEQAAILSIALFAGLSAIVLTTKQDFSFMRSIISIGSMIALGLIVAGMIFGFDLGLFFSGFMVALAAGSILYQTSNLVHQYHSSQYVAAALGLFASLMLLFWYILQILLRLASND